MREQKTKAQVRNAAIITRSYPPLLPLPTPSYKSTTPHLSHSSSICNNNTMGIEFLVQLRQSNKCESLRNDEIFNLHLGSDVGT